MSRELVVVVVVGRMKAEARHALHVYFAHCDGGLSTSLFFLSVSGDVQIQYYMFFSCGSVPYCVSFFGRSLSSAHRCVMV